MIQDIIDFEHYRSLFECSADHLKFFFLKAQLYFLLCGIDDQLFGIIGKGYRSIVEFDFLQGRMKSEKTIRTKFEQQVAVDKHDGVAAMTLLNT